MIPPSHFYSDRRNSDRHAGGRFRFIVAVIATLGTVPAAFAADMPSPASAPAYTKAPVPAPYSWTGFYAGGNVGYGWGNSNNNLAVLESSGFFGGPPFPLFNGTDTGKFDGGVGGAQAGYNWQIRNYLLGLETDIQASGQRGGNAFNGAIGPGNGPFLLSQGSNPVAVTDTGKLGWFGTVRGRLGVTSDRWLFYVTGGLAYGEVSESGNAQPANPFSSVANAPFLWNQSSTKVGWTIGAGVENAISGNWSWKVEYLYVDLGNFSSNVSGGVGTTSGFAENCYGTPGGGSCFGSNPALGSSISRFTDNIVRVGVDYRFY
jgi:outer membrane immunogenic protein